MWDMIREFFSPILRLWLNRAYISVHVIPAGEFYVRDSNSINTRGITVPQNKSVAIQVINASINPIDISNVGIYFRSGKELALYDFDLPVKIEAQNRHEFKLKPETFEMLEKDRLEKVKYFYVETPLFQRFKTAPLSMQDRERLTTSYYLDSGHIYKQSD